MKEQISEEFARELLSSMQFDGRLSILTTLEIWKQEGYIKQSREEEIRGELERLYSNCNNIEKRVIFRAFQLQKELIEILDNKDKQC